MLMLADIEPMLATSSPPFSREGWGVELKYDGFRLLAQKSRDGVRLRTRRGADATRWFPELEASLRQISGSWIVDGEVCVLDSRGVPAFERLKRRAALRGWRPGAEPAALFMFDLLAEGRSDVRRQPLEQRKARLQRLLGDKPPEGIGYVQHLPTEGKLLYEYALSLGVEGVVAKRLDSPYVGGRSRDWLKSKPAGFHHGWQHRPLQI